MVLAAEPDFSLIWPQSERSDSPQSQLTQKVTQCRLCGLNTPKMGGGGDRPKNHIPARYVTVINRTEGCIKYFHLDSKGCLVYEQGLPKLCKIEPFAIPEPTVATPHPTCEAGTQLAPVQEDSDEPAAPDHPFMLGQTGGEYGSDEFTASSEGWNSFFL
jgi:hypothetical protein